MDFLANELFTRNVGKLSEEMSRVLNHKLEKAQIGITSEQYKLLNVLWTEDGKTQHFICQSTGRDRGTVTRMIDTLERKKLVMRVQDKDDKRSNLIYLTSSGRKIKTAALQCAEDTYKATLSDFKETEINLFKRYLDRAVNTLAELDPQ